MLYADVIVDITHQALDRTYQYRVEPWQEGQIRIGSLVMVPFGRGNRGIGAYVVGLSQKPALDEEKIKPLTGVDASGVAIESQLIYLAYWMKERYGSTINQALKTVLPVKKTVTEQRRVYVKLLVSREEAAVLLEEARRKGHGGKVRLLEALLWKEGAELRESPQEAAYDKRRLEKEYHIARSTFESLEKQKVISLESETVYRNPIKDRTSVSRRVELHPEQRKITDGVLSDFYQGIRKTYLIHGITGSGKTEVYMEIIEGVVRKGYQAIMLIPEIALTYQMVQRFYQRFGARVSVLNSRMSAGERYDQYLRAKRGELSVMIGPRSALFTPFERLGLILLDEEQEDSYKSETAPKYHARETALERARLSDASVLLGSATPTVESYARALQGEYQLYTLTQRAVKCSRLAQVEVVDLKEEMRFGNRSVFSRSLQRHMEERLLRGEQSLLFINRRGYAGFVSCRSCGYVIKCPHCDVSLTFHKDGKLICHYCGHEILMPKQCPKCSSPYIAAFGTGTQKIEALVKKTFPKARVLRMDMDTTRGKEGHEKILAAFAKGQADILVGTQMIVKGHDFPNVTLVGILAADLSLYAGDYRAAEKTYDLLCQAAGRAGRAGKPGQVVIQTYNPEHYSIQAAAGQNYQAFYEQEIAFRNMLHYPPAGHMAAVLLTSREEEEAAGTAKILTEILKEKKEKYEGLTVLGPLKASVSKIKDVYRYLFYMKHEQEQVLTEAKGELEGYLSYSEHRNKVMMSFDLDPVSSY